MKKTFILTVLCTIPIISILTGCESGSEELCTGISAFSGCQTVNQAVNQTVNANIINSVTASDTQVPSGTDVTLEVSANNPATILWTELPGNVNLGNQAIIIVNVQGNVNDTKTYRVTVTGSAGNEEFRDISVTISSISAKPVTVVPTSDYEIFVPNGYTRTATPKGDYDGILLFGGLAADSSIEQIASFVVQRPTRCPNNDAHSVLEGFRNTLSSWVIQLSNVTTENLGNKTAIRSSDRIRLINQSTANALNNQVFELLGGNIDGAQFTDLPADDPQATWTTEFRSMLTVQCFDQNIVVIFTVVPENELLANEALLEVIGDGSNVIERGFEHTAIIDTFNAPSSNEADFLWVIDNSGTMKEEQNAVADAAKEFATRIENANLDWQAGVITTDSDEVQNNNFTSNVLLLSEIIKSLGANESVGGRGDEEAAIFFAERSLQFDGSVTSLGVPRSNASLSVIILSDERSHYTERSDVIFDETNNLFINRGYFVYAIVLSDADLSRLSGTSDQYDGLPSQYDDLANETDGLVGDISNLDSIPLIIEQIVDRAGGRTTPFVLTAKPISSTIAVKINETEIPQAAVDGWQYSPNVNTIAFYGDVMPQVGDVVTVAYEYIVK